MKEIKKLNEKLSSTYTKETALVELNKLYSLALENEKLSDALRIVGLKMKLYGLDTKLIKTELYLEHNQTLKDAFENFFKKNTRKK